MTTLDTPPQRPVTPAAEALRARFRRQGLYDPARRLAGYELVAAARGGDAATSRALTAALSALPVDAPSAALPLFTNLTRAFATGAAPLPCGPEHVVLELLADVPLDADVLAGLGALRDRGYRLAVGGLEGAPWRVPALRHADVVKVDAGAGSDLAGIVAVARAHAPRARIVAERVEDEHTLARCLALGVDLVQGRHLDGPAFPGAPAGLATSQLACLRLLTALAREDVANHEIEQLVTTDVALSMRVLRAAGSSTVALTRHVTSVRQAVLLLGRRELSSWVTLMLLGGAAGQPVPGLAVVLARAGACARLAPGGSDVAFTVGLLSGVAQVLGSPLDRLLATVGVDTAVRAALLQHAGEAGRALGAVLAWEGVDQLAVPGAVPGPRADAGPAAPVDDDADEDAVSAACVAALAEVLADMGDARS